MRIKLDENLPVEAVDVLCPLGHDVDTVDDEAMAGAADEDVLRAATCDGRLLITLDRGFGDIRRHPPGTQPVSSSFGQVTSSHRQSSRCCVILVLAHPLEDMVGCKTIVRNGLVRIRRP